MEQMEQNEKIEFETSKLVIATYNKIALWNNNDYDNDKQKGNALKIVSQDIIQNALEELLIGLNLKTGTEVTRGDVKVGEINSVKDQESFVQKNEQDIVDKLFNND